MTVEGASLVPDSAGEGPTSLSSLAESELLIAEARERISKLISALGIDVVISVDDVHFTGGEGSASEVTEALAGSVSLQSTVVDLLRVDASAAGVDDVDEQDAAAVADFVNENWTGFASGLQSQLLGSVRTLQQDLVEQVGEGQIADDLKAQVSLAAVFAGTAEFCPMSMTDWVATWRDLIADGRKYLVLIDRSFSREQEGAEDLGDTLVGELVGEVSESVWAGLLTRHAPDEGAERDLTQALRAKFPDHADRLVAIGKFRTTSLDLFPAGLRALLLVRELGAYRKLVECALETAAVAAAEAFAELSDYAVVESIATAQFEGTFELDHPLRPAHHAHASTLTSYLRDGAFFSESLPALRGAAIGAFKNAESDHAQIRGLLRADTFEPDDHINQLGLPIEIGDIFRFEILSGSNEGKYFILLGQACDLSVRSKGVRTPDIRTVTLSRVKPEPAERYGETMHLLGYLEAGDDQRWVVDLRAGYDLVIPIEVLDATVFNEDGVSRISVDYVEGRPMAASWMARLALLQKKAERSIERYAAFADQLKKVSSRDQILGALAADLTAGDSDPKLGATVTIDESAKTITYGVRRCGRLRAEIAARSADLAAQYRSRPAFELGIVREAD